MNELWYLSAVQRCTPPYRTAVEGALCARPTGVPLRLVGERGIVSAVAETIVFIGTAITVLILIYGGLLFVTAGDNRRKADRAKHTIGYALFGLIIMILAYAIVRFVLVALLGGFGAQSP